MFRSEKKLITFFEKFPLEINRYKINIVYGLKNLGNEADIIKAKRTQCQKSSKQF